MEELLQNLEPRSLSDLMACNLVASQLRLFGLASYILLACLRPSNRVCTRLYAIQAMRQADDNFAQAVYQTSRRAFARTLREALEAWDISTAEKVGGQAEDKC